jgi:hypothetical protein
MHATSRTVTKWLLAPTPGLADEGSNILQALLAMAAEAAAIALPDRRKCTP